MVQQCLTCSRRFHGGQCPRNNHLDEIIADLQDKLRRKPIMRFVKSAHAEMSALKVQLAEIIAEQKGAFEPSQAELMDYKARQLDDIVQQLESEIKSRGGSLD